MTDMEYIAGLTKKFEATLCKAIPDMVVFGSREKRVTGNLNFGFPNVEGARIVAKLGKRLAISTGSACASSSFEPSHVLQGMGLPKRVAATAIRVSIGRLNTEAEVDTAADWFVETME